MQERSRALAWAEARATLILLAVLAGVGAAASRTWLGRSGYTSSLLAAPAIALLLACVVDVPRRAAAIIVDLHDKHLELARAIESTLHQLVTAYGKNSSKIEAARERFHARPFTRNASTMFFIDVGAPFGQPESSPLHSDLGADIKDTAARIATLIETFNPEFGRKAPDLIEDIDKLLADTSILVANVVNDLGELWVRLLICVQELDRSAS